MLAFLSAESNLPFTVSLALMLGIAMLEVITWLLGTGLSMFLESLLPDLDLNGTEAHPTGALSQTLGWLRFGQVPALVLLIIFLTAFGLIGLVLQNSVQFMFDTLMPAYIAVIPAFFLTLPVVRTLGGVMAKIMPKDETEAVSKETFIGRIAVITLGKASVGSPAQAKIKDQYGQTHYIMLEPDKADIVLEADKNLLIIKQEGNIFKAIEESNPILTGE